jgi:hypothetical protein
MKLLSILGLVAALALDGLAQTPENSNQPVLQMENGPSCLTVERTPDGRNVVQLKSGQSSMQERTRAGLAVARQLGRTGGRKRQMTDSKIVSAKKLLASGVPPRDVAKNLGVSVPTLYRWIPAAANP